MVTWFSMIPIKRTLLQIHTSCITTDMGKMVYTGPHELKWMAYFIINLLGTKFLVLILFPYTMYIKITTTLS